MMFLSSFLVFCAFICFSFCVEIGAQHRCRLGSAGERSSPSRLGNCRSLTNAQICVGNGQWVRFFCSSQGFLNLPCLLVLCRRFELYDLPEAGMVDVKLLPAVDFA